MCVKSETKMEEHNIYLEMNKSRSYLNVDVSVQ